MIGEVFPILFGAAFTVATSVAMGMLLLERLRLHFYRFEAALFGFLAGSACLSLATFFLCLVHQARWQVFLTGGAGCLVAAFWQHRRQPARKPLPAVERIWLVSFFLILTPFFLCYFFNALAPEVSPDGSGYHLGNVAAYHRLHGFDWGHRGLYSYLPQGAEMLFLVAFSFGRHSSAALVHFAFLTALPVLIVCHGLRLGFPKPAMFAAILVYASPVVGLDGASAYNDVALVTLIYAGFYLLQVFYETNDHNILILIGLFAGFVYAIKYTGAIVQLPFAVFSVWRYSRNSRLQNLGVLLLAAAVTIVPWALRNWIWAGNPFAPFANAWFPNPYFHAGMEHRYLAELGRYEGLNHWWELPLQLTVRGGLVPGMLGPAFLLFPLALWSLRTPQGRRLLLAAVVFAVPAYFNTGSRFFIPSLPFLALALGLALANSPGVLPLVVVFQALVCWPTVLSTYADSASWRLHSIPVAAALRREPEDAFLLSRLPDLALRRDISQATTPADRIFSFHSRPVAYLDREVVVGYESSLGNLAQDTLWTAAGISSQPSQQLTVRFAPVDARAVRLRPRVQEASDWSIAELAVYRQGGEVAVPPTGVTARPNPWEAALAVDGNLVTRWSTWQPTRPGDFFQIDFGQVQKIDRIRLRNAAGTPAQLSVEILAESGRWQSPAIATELTQVSVADLKPLATQYLKRWGIGYLWIDESDPGMRDINRYSKSWGITQLAEANGTHFFRIE